MGFPWDFWSDFMGISWESMRNSMGFLIGEIMGCTLSNCPTRGTGGFFVRWENLRVILGHGDFLSHDDWRVNSSVLWSKICVNLPLLVGRDSFAGCVYMVNSWMRLTQNAGCHQFIFMRIYIPIISYTNCNESVMMVGWPYPIYIYIQCFDHDTHVMN